MASRTSLVLQAPAGGAVPNPVHWLQPSVHSSSHLAVPPTIAGAHSNALPSCTLTSKTPAQSGGAWLFWLEVAEGVLKKGHDFLSLHKALSPRAVRHREPE